MAMLTAYFDASGDNAGKGAVSVGGFVGDVRAWARFERQWRVALDAAHIQDFHMTDFVSGAEGFERYKGKPDLQAKVLMTLSRIIRKNTRRSFAWSIPLADWSAVDKVYRLKECRFTPYAIASLVAMTSAAMWIGRAGKGHSFSEIVFESGDPGQGDFRWYMDELIRPVRGHQKRAVRSIYPLFKPKGLLPLQACDFAMWEKRTDLLNLLGGMDRILRPSYTEIQKVPQTWALITAPTIASRAAFYGVPKRGEPFDRKTWCPKVSRP